MQKLGEALAGLDLGTGASDTDVRWERGMGMEREHAQHRTRETLLLLVLWTCDKPIPFSYLCYIL